jgi:hypothetical protein
VRGSRAGIRSTKAQKGREGEQSVGVRRSGEGGGERRRGRTNNENAGTLRHGYYVNARTTYPIWTCSNFRSKFTNLLEETKNRIKLEEDTLSFCVVGSRRMTFSSS